MGGILGGGSGGKSKPAAPYAGAQFQPYAYTNQVGDTTGKQEGKYGFNVTSNINPTLADMGQYGLNNAQPFMEGFLGGASRDLPMFQGVDNGEQRAEDIFNTQSALLQPKFDQQRQQLSNDLFGSGRLGLQLAGETAGAGAGGMVNPDAYGLGLAQSRALAELSSASRDQAMGEQQQMFGQALQGFGTNEAQRQKQTENYLGGYKGALGQFATVAEMEQALVNQGLNVEAARSAAQSASANAGSALANAGQKSGGGGMFSSLLGSAGESFGNVAGDAVGDLATDPKTWAAIATYFSDRKLKTNIRKVGELASGLNTYFWDWTEEAKQFVGNQSTFGVIAQEAQLLFPEATMMHPDGYLTVDYARIR
jgi:hypothetical protein